MMTAHSRKDAAPAAALPLSPDALSRILPMHLRLDAVGRVLSAGQTLLKIVPGLSDGVQGRLIPLRAHEGRDVIETVRQASSEGRRLFLGLSHRPDIVLRGHAVKAEDGTILLNLGFGPSLRRAIAACDLTDADFPPTDLVMEFLFLHEANRGVLSELSRFSAHLETARRMALSQAHSDALTGLLNRRGLTLALAALLRPGQAEGPRPFALVQLDLDHFKPVNDRLGHQAGDALLIEIAIALRQTIRQADMAARLGGDEFVVILRDMTCREQLARMALRIIEAVEARSPEGIAPLKLGASLGIVTCQGACRLGAEAILAAADRALYRSKNAGRGCATIEDLDAGVGSNPWQGPP